MDQSFVPCVEDQSTNLFGEASYVFSPKIVAIFTAWESINDHVIERRDSNPMYL